jgi:hypothetical protein
MLCRPGKDVSFANTSMSIDDLIQMINHRPT